MDKLKILSASPDREERYDPKTDKVWCFKHVDDPSPWPPVYILKKL